VAASQPQVNVVFGASLGGLLAGVKQVEHAIEGLRKPIDDFYHSIAGIAEATGALFALEKISEWVEQISEAAEKVDILADAFGTSAERMLAFQNTLEVLGGGGANLIRVAQMIGRELETSINDPLSKQRVAIDAAKISMGELKDALGSPLEELELLRKAWQSLAGNPQRLEIFRDLVGPRGLTMVLPYLEATDDKLEELQKQLGKTGANMPTADIKNLHDMAEEVHLLEKAFTGLADTIVVRYSESIKDALKVTKEWVEYIKDNIPQIVKYFAELFSLEGDRKFLDDLEKKWEEFSRHWDDLQEKFGHGRPGGSPPTLELPGGGASTTLPPSEIFGPPIPSTFELYHPGAHPETFGPPMPEAHSEAHHGVGTTAETLKDISGNAKLVADALSGLGLNATQLAGILANLQRESGFDPTKVGSSGDTGIAQWVGDRLTALKAAEGPAWNTIQGQIDFLLKELQGQFSGVLTKMRSARTSEQSSQIFGGGFEVHHGGPGGKGFDEEQAKRDELAGQIASGGGLSSTSITGGKGTPLPNYKADYEAFSENEKLKLIEAKGNGQEILKIYDEWLAQILQIYAKDGEAAGKGSKEYQSVARERLHAAQAQAQQEITAEIELQNVKIKNRGQAEAEDLKQTDRLLQFHQINANDAKQKELEIVEAHRKAVNEILEQELALALAIPALRTRINAQIDANDLASKQQQTDINDKFEDDTLKKAQEINQTIARDFASNLMQIATGKTTIVQAFAKLGEELGQKMVEKLMEKFLESSLFGAGGAGGLLSGLFGNLFGGAAGSAATGVGGGILGGLFSKLFGGGVSFATDAAGIMAFSRGGIIPSAAGGWVIPSFASGGILAQVHSNEMVLPADISQGMQSMIRGGGGGGGTVNIHAWDTQTGAQALARNNQAVANSFRTGMASGGTSPRALSRGGGRYP
jgi:hypothetical protein